MRWLCNVWVYRAVGWGVYAFLPYLLAHIVSGIMHLMET
jgi:hypothetical protein